MIWEEEVRGVCRAIEPDRASVPDAGFLLTTVVLLVLVVCTCPVTGSAVDCRELAVMVCCC